ncbi:DUF4365 domain-containing protein [Cellvibrio sp. UBA7661]|uniref:DUF4365 domain-containing protein n=1 Tax=Cellvibrio sp. UBA7661 TaxID=1946311 RepID=UPI002F35CA91
MGRFSPTERIGVNAVECIILSEFGWIFREQETSDVGVDAQIEIVDENEPTGKIIGLQIKTGASHVEDKPDHYVFRGTKIHADYWLNHALPMILTVHLPDSGDTYWEILNEKTIRRTEKGFAIKLPKEKKLNASAYEDLLRLAKSKRSLSHKAIELCKAGKESEAKELLMKNEGQLDDESKVLLSVFSFNEKKFERANDLLAELDLKNISINFLQYYYVIKAECYSKLNNEKNLIGHIRNAIDFLNSQQPNPTQELGQESPIDEYVTSTPIQPIDLLIANSIRFRLSLSLLEYEHKLISVEKFLKSTFFQIGFGISRNGEFVTDPESVMRAVYQVLSNYDENNTYDQKLKVLTKDWLTITLKSMKGIHEYVPLAEIGAKLTIGPTIIPNVEHYIDEIESLLNQFIAHYQLIE